MRFRMFSRISDEMVRRLEPSTLGVPMEQGVEALKSIYSEGDAYMSVEARPNGSCLVERNCPFYNAAIRRPAICSVCVQPRTGLVGPRVDREESFQKSDGHCAFHVRPDQLGCGEPIPFGQEPQATI